MKKFLYDTFLRLKIRWKLMAVVLPLVVLPIFFTGALVGRVATEQAVEGLIHRSKADLDHLAHFTLDLLEAHERQFQVYQEDRKQTVRNELATLVDLAVGMVEAEDQQVRTGFLSAEKAMAQAGKAMKQVHIGETGYLFAMDSKGNLKVHYAQQGANVYDERDEDGNYFIRDMCLRAKRLDPAETAYIVYPWRNPEDPVEPRLKMVAFRYVPQWDWVVAAGKYLDESYEDYSFERASFQILKEKLQQKRVGESGYIFCLDRKGVLQIHPDAEGRDIYDSRDSEGNAFIQEMCRQKSGWIRYPWRNEAAKKARMKIVRYLYFEPWDWIVAVGSYEDEFYQPASMIKWKILQNIFLLPVIIGAVVIVMLLLASRLLTEPINQMIEVIRKARKGNWSARMEIPAGDELGELAGTFNRMAAMIQQHKEIEANLSQHGKMASLGILSSGVAHEINNPLGVILGYAAHLEKKLEQEDPCHRYVREIHRESKRCKKIVQNLLSFARTPKPHFSRTDLNELLGEIIDFASNHTDLQHVRLKRDFEPELPMIDLDQDLFRQVAINLLLNAGAAIDKDGRILVSTWQDGDQVIITFQDTGSGIPAEYLEKIFEPFFTTRSQGTGLGLAITKQIIEQHDGDLTIDSDLGRGSTVKVIIPVRQKGAEHGDS
ncbi:MAG: histidine kinase [Desulfuromonas sp.]|nr:MAG: histidine kinase [Desulfuromonas sp.]